MGPTERLSLLIESRTTGDAEVTKLERALVKVLEKSEQTRNEINAAAKSAEEFAIAIGLVAAAGKAMTETVQGVVALTKAYGDARGAGGMLIDTYRGVRLGVAALTSQTALMFTGMTIGATVAAEKILAISNAYAQVIEKNALFAAQSERSFRSVQTFAGASAITGSDLSFLGRFDPNKVRDYVSELERMQDPLERARRAHELFGKDADKVYELLGTQINRRIDDAQDMADRLDGPTRASIQRMRDDLKAIGDGNPFRVMSESLAALREEAKQGITIKVAAVFDFFRGAKLPQPVQDALQQSGGGFGAEGGMPYISKEDQDLLMLPSDQDFARMLAGMVKMPKAPGVPTLSTSSQRSAAATLADKRFGNLASLRSQLAAAEASANVLAGAVAGGGSAADASAVALLQTEKRIEGLKQEIKTIEKLQKAEQDLAELRKKLAEDEAYKYLAPEQRRQAEAVARFGGGIASAFEPAVLREQQAIAAKTQAAEQASFKEVGAAVGKVSADSLEGQTRLFQFNLSRSIQKDEEFVRSSKQRIDEQNKLEKTRLDLQTRAIALIAGPGGELAAVRQIAEIRIAAAKTEEEKLDAILDREEKIAELRKKQIAETRETAGRVFDAMLQGPAGLRTLALGTLGGAGRTAFQNLSQEFQGGLSGKLALPGQTKADGTLNLFGRLLKGTPFGIDPQKQALDANTMATQLNTQAILAGAGARGAMGGGGVAGGLSSLLGLPGGVMRGAGSNPLIFSNTTPSYDVDEAGNIVPYSGPQTYGTRSASKPAYDVDAQGNLVPIGQGSGRALKGIGIAGAAVGGAFGLAAGIKQGGLRGAMTGTSALAGAASSILMLSGATGPAAPILAGVALGAMMVGSFLPDPKKQRGEAIDRNLSAGAYTSPAAMNYAMTTGGAGFDYNRFGALRPIVIQQTIQAMDAKNLIDRRTDIAEATRLAMQEAHPLGDEIRGLVAA